MIWSIWQHHLAWNPFFFFELQAIGSLCISFAWIKRKIIFFLYSLALRLKQKNKTGVFRDSFFFRITFSEKTWISTFYSPSVNYHLIKMLNDCTAFHLTDSLVNTFVWRIVRTITKTHVCRKFFSCCRAQWKNESCFLKQNDNNIKIIKENYVCI